MKERLTSYGGQAVIEGVMMRGSHVCAIAVRAPDKSIVIKSEPLSGLYRGPLAKIPFLRGLLILWDALVLGMRGLSYSANIQSSEEEQIEGRELALAMLGSLGVAIVIFFLLPAGIAYLFEEFLHWNTFSVNIIEGLIRLAMLIGYIWRIGRIPEIHRVYCYHGAEHKTINAFEAGASLEPETVMRYPREHARCGTAFLLTVVIFSIIIFSILGPMPLMWRFISRILFIPVLAGISYEYIRLTAKLLKYPLGRIIAAPNLGLQKLTTQEPDLEMLEVAIASFNEMRSKEES